MGEIQITEGLLGLVETTCGLVHASYSLPKWQAVKLTFFAPCTRHLLTTVSDAPLASALFPLNTLGKLTVFGEKLTLKIAIFSFEIITLTVTKEEQLKDV